MSSADVYQGFLHAQAYGRTDGEAIPTSLLVHPTDHAEPHAEVIRLRRPDQRRVAELIVFGLPVRLTLDLIDRPASWPAATLRRSIERSLGEPQEVALV